MRVRGKQEKSKDYFDRVKSVKDLEVESGDWVLVKKPMKINKGDSKFSQTVKVEKISRRAVCLQGRWCCILNTVYVAMGIRILWLLWGLGKSVYGMRLGERLLPALCAGRGSPLLNIHYHSGTDEYRNVGFCVVE
ncbi:hypothetical protein NDU88_003770 [Pleurodeles waltl]|uniref:Uncharacterized protein n=1 Tax=Pleurodeles waltl TaxID=8319 RepID=A0AAV7UZG6_PLEWA|nr:hypothetical protein NDU88_003770 [Pleurodeles waltl]